MAILSRLLGGVVLALAGASLALAQPVKVSIDDLRVVEGDSGTTDVTFTVQLSASSALGVTVDWTTIVAAPGSATPGVDYVESSGGLVFNPGETAKPVTVVLNGDTSMESDETFYVELENAVGVGILKGRGVATILDDDENRPPVRFATAITDVSLGQGRNRLQWQVPAGVDGVGTFVDWFRINWNVGQDCNFPPSPTATSDGQWDETPPSPPEPGSTFSWEHTGLALDETYCYAIWAHFSSGRYSNPEPELKATTWTDPTGARLWSYSTGAGTTNVVPPVVGFDGVFTIDANGDVHAASRGTAGGLWPAPWHPVSLGARVQWRSPVIPLAWGSLLYAVTDDQRMHAVNTNNGSLVWSTPVLTPAPVAALGPAGGIFSRWGGRQDVMLMGTAAATDNRVYAFHPETGRPLGFFPDADDGVPGLGRVGGMSLDYSTNPNRIYLTTRQGGTTQAVWCLEILPDVDGNVDIDLAWAVDVGSGIDGAPVLRAGRLLLGDNAGSIHSLAVSDGGDPRSFATGNGAVKGFPFPDRRNLNFYFATNDTVWGLFDDPGGVQEAWRVEAQIPNPSIVLLWPGTQYVYVGGGNGQLHQIDTDLPDPSVGVETLSLGAPGLVVGAPSLDGGYGLLHVGGTDGVIHAVQVPLGGGV